jgi:predicted transcriptional regulator
LKLVNDHDNVEKIAVDFDDDKKFISEVVYFLADIGWIKEDRNGTYRMTRKGRYQ